MFDTSSEQYSFENECEFQVDVELASFPSLPRPQSQENEDFAPFNSEIDVTDFLTSQPLEQSEGHIVDLAAIAHRSSVMATCVYSAQVQYDNAGDMRNDRENHAGPMSASRENSPGEMAHEKRRPNHRSRRGCWTCRLRHKACPEDGSPCSSCSRLNLRCDTGVTRPVYMQDRLQATERLREIRLVTDKLRGRYIRHTRRRRIKWGQTGGLHHP